MRAAFPSSTDQMFYFTDDERLLKLCCLARHDGSLTLICETAPVLGKDGAAVPLVSFSGGGDPVISGKESAVGGSWLFEIKTYLNGYIFPNSDINTSLKTLFKTQK